MRKCALQSKPLSTPLQIPLLVMLQQDRVGRNQTNVHPGQDHYGKTYYSFEALAQTRLALHSAIVLQSGPADILSVGGVDAKCSSSMKDPERQVRGV